LLQRRNNNNIRKQKKIANSFGETVRIASLVHKGMKSGRSSYVEMRALARLTNHNVKNKIQSIKSLINKPRAATTAAVADNDKIDELSSALSEIPSAVSEGYTKVLSPNGMIREDSLDRLLAMDSEIVIALATIESHLRAKEKPDAAVRALKEILKERKEFSASLTA
jgi:hypothetical protein